MSPPGPAPFFPHAQTLSRWLARSKMLQQITLAVVLSLAAFLPAPAAAYHSPIDILRRGPVHATVLNKRDALEVHDDSFKRFSFYNKVTARTYCVCGSQANKQALTVRMSSVLGQRDSDPRGRFRRRRVVRRPAAHLEQERREPQAVVLVLPHHRRRQRRCRGLAEWRSWVCCVAVSCALACGRKLIVNRCSEFCGRFAGAGRGVRY